MSGEQTNIKVVVRVRPFNKRELELNQRSVIRVIDKGSLLFDPVEDDDEFFFQGAKQNYRDISKRVNKKLAMEFDRVFDIENTNMDIFKECTAPLVDSVLNGYNCSVFVYGATGAGKTFTMLGNPTYPGLTFLTMRDLFEKIQSQNEIRKFDVGVSYLEVYNEQVMNLLTKTGPLKLREDANGVVVSGLILTPICSAEELLRLLAIGNSNRTQHPTDANAESSRSHAIFQVHIRMTDRKTGSKRLVKLSMIDLAGSERAASTKGMGIRFKEGASINKSLLALGNCINKLADGLKHIPYRDSNLTRILKDSLGGNCQTLMVANISMSSTTYEDTYNTLKYASRAKKIRSIVRQNTLKSNMPKEFYIKKLCELTNENEHILERNKLLELKLSQLEKNIRNGCIDESELIALYSKIDAVFAPIKTSYENMLRLRSNIKSLTYREEINKDFERFRKVLSLDERIFQEDYGRYQAYMKNLAVEKNDMKEQLSRSRKIHDMAHRKLEILKNEIKDSKYASILNNYIKSKEFDIVSVKQLVTNYYLESIFLDLSKNSDALGKSLDVACDIVKKTYKTLEIAQKLTPDIQKLYDKLKRHMLLNDNRDLSLKHKGLDLIADTSDEDDNTEMLSASSSTKRPTVTALKSHRSKNRILEFELENMDDTDSDNACTDKTIFKKPRIFDETQTISCADDEYSSGVESTATKAVLPVVRPRTVNRRLVTDILSDQNIRASGSSREKLTYALIKSNNFRQQDLQRTMAAASQKENMKLNTNCVRKSPRTVVSKALAGTTSFARKQTSRLATTVGVKKEEPQVRINRAASFRVKKI